MFKSVWNSPVLNTWASIFGRTLGAVLVLPLVLRRFPVEEFNVWSIFATLLGLQMLVDMGFSVTFVRAIAISLAGAESTEAFLRNTSVTKGSDPNWDLLTRVIGTMRFIYKRLALIYFFLLVTGGTFALARPIKLSSEPISAWLAWAIIVLTGYVNVRSNYLTVLLQGVNQIALIRRWEAITSIAAVFAGSLAINMGGNLLGLVASMQVWSIVAAIRNRWLCQNIADRRYAVLPEGKNDPAIVACLWPATWRSGLGVLMSFGLIQATGLINAQIATPANSASYLFCLRILQVISGFAQAPFYSKLPILPRLRAEGNTAELLKVAGNGMCKSLWTYVIGFTAVGLLGPGIIDQIHSKVAFPEPKYWVVLGAMIFIERYAAMHLHLYSTTNQIITHIANGITGFIAIIATSVTLPSLGPMAFPVGLLIGYAAFYSWYPARHSYKEFKMNFIAFETSNTLFPLLVFLGASIFIVLRH